MAQVVDVVISRMEKADVPSVYNLLLNEGDIKNVAANYLQSENILADSYIARNERECLGFIMVESGFKSKEILFLYVTEKYRNIKIGSQLLNKVKEDAVKDKKSLKLFFHKNLLDFYKKNDFKISDFITYGIWDYTQKKEN